MEDAILKDRTAVATLGEEARATFIRRTYGHLFGAVIGFTLLEVVLFRSGLADSITASMSKTWLLFLGGFMVVGWLASRTAHTAKSLAAQYLALGAYVVAEALLFVPLLYIANVYAPGAISSAALVTLFGFTALTAIVVYTKKDFVFLRSVLMWGGISAVLLIVAAAIFGFQLGTVFSVAMVFLAGAAILYDTSNILFRYPEDRYVGAALGLFASVALMFWYVLRIFIASRD
jgi:FtsH-binding integral membrane protein